MNATSLPRALCLCAAPSVLLSTVMPWTSYGPGSTMTLWQTQARLDVLVLLLSLTVAALAGAALTRRRRALDRAMAISALALGSILLSLFVERGLGGMYSPAIGVYVAFLGGLVCLAAGLLVIFPTLADSARELARAAVDRPATGGPPAGWYDDPAGGDGVRWWDGVVWSDPDATTTTAPLAHATES